MSVFGVFLVRNFPHSGWLRWDTPYLFVFTRNTKITPNTETFHAVLYLAYIFPDSYIVIFHSAVHDNCSAYSRRRYCLFWWFLRIRLNVRLKNLYCRLKKIRARPQISLLTLSKLINLETIPKKNPNGKNK